MPMEGWIIVLILVVIAMAEVLRQLSKSRVPFGNRSTVSRSSRRSKSSSSRMNYDLAPKKPEIMAVYLFELLSTVLNYQQMVSFANLVVSPDLTDRYIGRLSSRKATASLAGQLAFLCDSMEANGFSPESRAEVSAALLQKAKNEYKLLQIHKNLDKLI